MPHILHALVFFQLVEGGSNMTRVVVVHSVRRGRPVEPMEKYEPDIFVILVSSVYLPPHYSFFLLRTCCRLQVEHIDMLPTDEFLLSLGRQQHIYVTAYPIFVRCSVGNVMFSLQGLQ